MVIEFHHVIVTVAWLITRCLCCVVGYRMFIPDVYTGCLYRMFIPDVYTGCLYRMFIPDVYTGCLYRMFIPDVQDFTLDFYFRQHWHDPRLNFTDEEDELCISNEMLERIWWPDTFFANAKQASFHTATTHNAFIRINPAGWITLSLRSVLLIDGS